MPEIVQRFYRDGQLVEEITVQVPVGETNRSVLQDRLKASLQDNRDYLSLPAPTANQTAAHVRRMARQNLAIIRLLLGTLESTDDA